MIMKAARLLLGLACVIYATASSDVYAQAPVRPSAADRQEIIRLINKERAANGLEPVAADDRLTTAAQSQADYMIKIGKMDHLQGSEPARGKNYKELKHNWTQSDWHAINRIVKAGYVPFEKIWIQVIKDGRESAALVDGIYDMIGENVAYAPAGAQDRFSPKRIVQGWMDSAGHRTAILNPRFREIGVGYSVSTRKTKRSQQAAAWCTVFATPEIRK